MTPRTPLPGHPRRRPEVVRAGLPWTLPVGAAGAIASVLLYGYALRRLLRAAFRRLS